MPLPSPNNRERLTGFRKRKKGINGRFQAIGGHCLLDRLFVQIRRDIEDAQSVPSLQATCLALESLESEITAYKAQVQDLIKQKADAIAMGSTAVIPAIVDLVTREYTCGDCKCEKTLVRFPDVTQSNVVALIWCLQCRAKTSRVLTPPQRIALKRRGIAVACETYFNVLKELDVPPPMVKAHKSSFTKTQIDNLPEEGNMTEIAGVLGVHLVTVHQWHALENLPVNKLAKGAGVLIRKDDLIRFLMESGRYA